VEWLAALGFFLLAIVAVFLLSNALRLMRSNNGEYTRNRERAPTLRDILKGTAKTKHDGVRDYRVTAGLAVNTKTNSWELQGRLSEEAIDSVVSSKNDR